MPLARKSFLGVKAICFTDGRWKRQPSDPQYVFGAGLPATTIFETPPAAKSSIHGWSYSSVGRRENHLAFFCAHLTRGAIYVCAGIKTRRVAHAEDSRGKTHVACAQDRHRLGDWPHEDVLSSCHLLSDHPDRDHQQGWGTAIGSLLSVDGDPIRICGSNRRRLGQLDVGPTIVERGMRAVLVVSGSVMIQSTL